MKKLFSFFAFVLLIVSLELTTVYAGVTSFSKGYGFQWWKSNYITTGANLGIDGKTFDGSVVGAGDIVLTKDIPANELNDFNHYFNGVSNAYTWLQYVDGSGKNSYKKLYGQNLSGFKGYSIDGEGAIGVSTTPRIETLTTDYLGLGKGGSLYIRPKQKRCTFGRYDLDLSGVSEFKFLFSVNMFMPDTEFSFVQGENSYLQSCDKEYKFMEIDRTGSVKIFDESEARCQINIKQGYTTPDTHYLATFVLDATGKTPKCKIMFKNYASSEYLFASDWTPIKNVDFDFESDMGIRLFCNGFNAGEDLQIAEFSMNKTEAPLQMVTEQEDLDKIRIPSDGGSVEFRFNKKIDMSKLWAGSVYALDENENGVELSTSCNNDTLKVTFSSLDPEKEYKIYFADILSFNGDAYSGEFKVYSSDIAELISAQSYYDGSNSKVDVKLKNYGKDTQNCIILLSVNDGDNMLSGVYYLPIEISGKSEKTYTLSDINQKLGDEYEYKVYLIDNFMNMKPLSDALCK